MFTVVIESSGPHSNGFSLIRKILSESDISISEKKDIANKLLMPTILYPKLILKLLDNFKINSISYNWWWSYRKSPKVNSKKFEYRNTD